MKIAETIIVLVIIAMIYGGWQFKRWLNWKYKYEPKTEIEIQKELEPMRKELAELKARIEKLEQNGEQE